jgi:3-deoxy-manno-octulosonate cytidylyltransferase (CMP-KDO synthetase)
VVIPARYASTRLPGKALADLYGQPMVVRVLHQVQRVAGISGAVVATDDSRIADAVSQAGGQAVMTRTDHTSGTDRIAEALHTLEWSGEVVVNVQGDEPLIEPATIEALITAMDDPEVQVATVAAPLTEDPTDPAVVKVVVDRRGRALYFSRAPIPYGGPYLQHIGIYAYRASALARFVTSPPAPLEQTERLEQLRFLAMGCPIAVVQVEAASPSVDTPADLERVRCILKP